MVRSIKQPGSDFWALDVEQAGHLCSYEPDRDGPFGRTYFELNAFIRWNLNMLGCYMISSLDVSVSTYVIFLFSRVHTYADYPTVICFTWVSLLHTKLSFAHTSRSVKQLMSITHACTHVRRHFMDRYLHFVPMYSSTGNVLKLVWKSQIFWFYPVSGLFRRQFWANLSPIHASVERKYFRAQKYLPHI